MIQVKCNKCGYVGEKSEFLAATDLFQKEYVTGCPKCDNGQSPGEASLRMMPGQSHPFSYVRPTLPDTADSLVRVLYEADEAS